jgi:hypothetical protein
MSSIESILAEIDSAVAPKVSLTKQASSTDVSVLAQKLASAAAALEKQASQPKAAVLSTADRSAVMAEKIAEAVVVSSGLSLVAFVPEAVQFAKTAGAAGHDSIGAFKFFLSQKAKELGL